MAASKKKLLLRHQVISVIKLPGHQERGAAGKLYVAGCEIFRVGEQFWTFILTVVDIYWHLNLSMNFDRIKQSLNIKSLSKQSAVHRFLLFIRRQGVWAKGIKTAAQKASWYCRTKASCKTENHSLPAPYQQGKELLHATHQFFKAYETFTLSVQHHFSGVCNMGVGDLSTRSKALLRLTGGCLKMG